MSTLASPKLGLNVPAKHYSRLIKFIEEIARHEPQGAATSVDIFSNDDNQWYCQVCRGGQKTKPMGPSSKQQAERVQDARRIRIAAKGTAWLVFEETGQDENGPSSC
ncbi:hypothetical protein AB4Z52_28790 [Rhizobium sp. 2YAF20]|uniref:hypothetical protein n=1 Tax=Rhizobium sp. 2YAF20 TaxID=3233027 RepID=UPI003F9E4FFE